MYQNTLGDGTVTLRSATINNSIDLSKLFIKHGSSGKLASHIGMITGNDDGFNGTDVSTIEFIKLIISGEYISLSQSELNSEFGITCGIQ